MSDGVPDWWRRLGIQVETVGVAPIPLSRRTASPGRLLLMWAMATSSAGTAMLGNFFYREGLWFLLLASGVTWVVLLIPSGLFSEMGRMLPITGLMFARRSYGWVPTTWLSVLFCLVNIAFFGIATATGAQILAAATHTGTGWWYWVVGGFDIVLVVFGYRWLEAFYRYTAVIFIACYGALVAYLLTHFSLHIPHRNTPVHWGTALSTVAGYCILSWAYELPTLSRFCRPAERTAGRSRWWFFLAPGVGIMIPNVGLGVLGMFSQQAIGTWNVAVLGAHVPGWGVVAAIGTLLGIAHTNAMNLYPSTIDLLVAVGTVRAPRRWHQPAATMGLGIVGIVLAVVGILGHAETFVTDVGALVGPFAFVIIVDWFARPRGRTDLDSYLRRTRLSGTQVPAVVCFLVGSAVSLWGADFLPAAVNDTVPLSIAGSVIAGLAYVAYLSIARRGRFGGKIVVEPMVPGKAPASTA